MAALRIPFLGVEDAAEKIIFNIRFALGTARDLVANREGRTLANVASSAALFQPLLFFDSWCSFKTPPNDALQHFAAPLSWVCRAAGHYRRPVTVPVGHATRNRYNPEY
jgi:hypothetical protein